MLTMAQPGQKHIDAIAQLEKLLLTLQQSNNVAIWR
jgi:hypothetical protein